MGSCLAFSLLLFGLGVHLLHGGRQVKNRLNLSSGLKFLKEGRFFSWLVHPCGCQLLQDVQTHSLLCCVQCTPETPRLRVLYNEKVVWFIEQTSLLALRLFSYTLFLYKLFFIITELQKYFSFGRVLYSIRILLFFS